MNSPAVTVATTAYKMNQAKEDLEMGGVGDDADKDGKKEKKEKGCADQNPTSSGVYLSGILALIGMLASWFGGGLGNTPNGIFFLVCTIAGFWGGYQLWLLGSIQEQLDEFERQNEAFEKSNAELKKTNEEFKAETQKLSGEVDEFREANDKLSSTAANLKSSVADYEKQNDEFEDQVKQMREEREEMDEANKELKASLDSQKEMNTEMENKLKKFEKIQASIEGIMEKSGKEFDEAFDGIDEATDQLQRVAEQIQKTLDTQLCAQIEQRETQFEELIDQAYDKFERLDKDGNDVLDKSEWPKFVRRLPKHLKSIIEKSDAFSLEFEDIDTDGKGELDYDEIEAWLEKIKTDQSEKIADMFRAELAEKVKQMQEAAMQGKDITEMDTLPEQD